jgi:predicted transcriptional regulator of viral defense system
MRLNELNKSNKLILSIDDLSKEFSIGRESAKVTANRYVKQGLLLRIKRNFYITPDKFDVLNEDELYKIANLIQIPSYISLSTALTYYNISTQQLRGIIESIAIKRGKSVRVKEIEFRFVLVNKYFYSGFTLKDNFFIALPEKAVADTIYLSSLGKYNCDFNAIDFQKLDTIEVNKYIEMTNQRTKTYWKSLCRSYKI